MRSKMFLLCLALLLSASAWSFSDVPDEEIIAILGLISTELETASTRQDEISAELGKVHARQSEISSALETVQTERLPAIAEQVDSLETSFDAYVRREERDDALMLGATIAALLLAALALIF